MSRNEVALGLDRFLCGALVILARLFTRPMRRREVFDFSSARQIVVSKYVGLGSLLLSQGLLAGIRKNFPAARVTYLTFDASAEIFRFMPGLADEVMTVRTSSLPGFLKSSFEATRKLREKRVDIFFDIEFFSRYSALMAHFSRPRMSVGFGARPLGSRTALYTRAAAYDPTVHVTQNFLNMLRAIDVGAGESQAYPVIRPAEDISSRIQARLAAFGLKSGAYFVLNPNASDALGGYRHWPLPRWTEFIRLSLKEGFSPLVLTGTKGDAPYVASLFGRLPDKEKAHVRNLSGAFNLEEYSAFLAASRAVVTVDSGTSHFAMALGRPTVILFGPESPLHYGYEAPHCRVVYKGVYCSPCYNIYDGKKIICRNEHRCMTTIEPSEVLAALKQLL